MLDYTPAGKGRGEGSPAGLGRGDGFRSPAIERPSAEVADLKRRVAELEGDARSEASRGVDGALLLRPSRNRRKSWRSTRKETEALNHSSHLKGELGMMSVATTGQSRSSMTLSKQRLHGLANDGDGVTEMESSPR